MSTRSVVALPRDGGWEGRYVHSDGYPEARVPILTYLIERDGLDEVISNLIEDNYGWSYLDENQDRTMHQMYRDGRFIARPGYGLAYTYEQAGSDRWLTNNTADALWIEWVYILNATQIDILMAVPVEGTGDLIMGLAREWTWKPWGYARHDGEIFVYDPNQTTLV